MKLTAYWWVEAGPVVSCQAEADLARSPPVGSASRVVNASEEDVESMGQRKTVFGISALLFRYASNWTVLTIPSRFLITVDAIPNAHAHKDWTPLNNEWSTCLSKLSLSDCNW